MSTRAATVLVVEDEAAQRELIAGILTPAAMTYAARRMSTLP